MRGFVPSANLYTVPGELFIAAGIVGATIMPHNLFLHTSLVLTRNVDRNDVKAVRAAIRYSTVDTVVALLFALFVNAAILIVAASTFNVNGYTNIATLEGGRPCVLSFPCYPQRLRVDRASLSSCRTLLLLQTRTTSWTPSSAPRPPPPSSPSPCSAPVRPFPSSTFTPRTSTS